MPRKVIKAKRPRFITIVYDNDNGSADEWKFDTSYNPMRVVEVIVNIRRRIKK